MKTFLLILVLNLMSVAGAQTTFTICGKNDANVLIRNQTRSGCELGRELVKGLVVAQSKQEEGSVVNIEAVHHVLRSGQLVIDANEFARLGSLEKESNFILDKAVQQAGYPAGTLKVKLKVQARSPRSKSNIQSANTTGTRGGVGDYPTVSRAEESDFAIDVEIQ